GERNRSFRIDAGSNQSGIDNRSVVAGEIFRSDWFLRAGKCRQVILGIEAHHSSSGRGNVRGNVSTEWTPAAITTGEKDQRLRLHVRLLIELKLDRGISYRSIERDMRYLVRHFLDSYVMSETLIPNHRAGGHSADQKCQGQKHP